MTSKALTLEVDLTNPGQFLACCGLFELASCLKADCLSYFEGRNFSIDGAPPDVLEKFVECPITAVSDAVPGLAQYEPNSGLSEENSDDDKKEPKSPPVWLGAPFNLRLDWWGDESAVEAGFKTWSAGMTVLGFFNGAMSGGGKRKRESQGMRDHLARSLPVQLDLFNFIETVDEPAPFNFDSRLSRNIAIDLGFVGNVAFAFSPAVEVLAMIGLQRFRPKSEIRWSRNTYSIWKEKLPLRTAAAVTHGLISALSSAAYSFAVKPRDAQGRYKAFGRAILERT